MTVAPELETLMRVIEDHQDKMPEGEYLAAMNALGSLHRQANVVLSEPTARVARRSNLYHIFTRIRSFIVNLVPNIPTTPPSYAASVPLFSIPNSQSSTAEVGMNQDDRVALNRVKLMIPEYRAMRPGQWMALSQLERDTLNIQSVEGIVNRNEQTYRNPNPFSCPFMARHAVGPWRISGAYTYWTCVCGYKGKTSNCKKHEESERHQDWAKHREVSRRIVKKMKKIIEKDETGDFISFKPYSLNCSAGIRYYRVCQEKNEWTHPELFAPLHVFTKPISGTWFVHPRDYKDRQYIA